MISVNLLTPAGVPSALHTLNVMTRSGCAQAIPVDAAINIQTAALSHLRIHRSVVNCS
jgi:hypothetical protein